jgi:hypothetical protein
MVRSGMNNTNTIKNKILRSIQSNPKGNWEGSSDPTYDFYIQEGSNKRIINSIDLAGEIVGVTDENTLIEFTKEENGDIMIREIKTNESVSSESGTIQQLKKIRKGNKGITIDDEVSKMDRRF